MRSSKSAASDDASVEDASSLMLAVITSSSGRTPARPTHGVWSDHVYQVVPDQEDALRKPTTVCEKQQLGLLQQIARADGGLDRAELLQSDSVDWWRLWSSNSQQR